MLVINAEELELAKFILDGVPTDREGVYMRGWNDAIDTVIEHSDPLGRIKHGHWYSEDNYMGTGTTMFFCSNCGSQSNREDPYCWNCGSKMEVNNG